MIAELQLATHLVANHLQRSTPELGITQGEAHVLVLVVTQGATTIADLHKASGLKRSTLTSLLDRLEERKLVRRAPNRADRRSVMVIPTAAGTRAGRRVTAVLEELEQAVRQHVDERDLAGVGAVAHALQAIVDHG